MLDVEGWMFDVESVMPRGVGAPASIGLGAGHGLDFHVFVAEWLAV